MATIRFGNDAGGKGAGDLTGGRPGVSDFARNAITYVQVFNGRMPHTVDRDHIGVAPIARLRRRVMRAPPSPKSQEVAVEGTFFPAVLLCSGWWERSRRTPLADTLQWRDELQHWLFSGFEQWGPSWDVNPADRLMERHLIGQIGDGDEADSLPVIIAASKAEDIRAKLVDGAKALRIVVKGFLCHRSGIEVGLQKRIPPWGKSFDYCLLVSADEPDHQARPCDEAPGMYSAYLWQCWLPRSMAQHVDGGGEAGAVLAPPGLCDVYFLWEHTNLTQPDAVKYNVDSLRRKADFLRSQHGDLLLVQKCSDMLDGEQMLSREDFYRFVMADGHDQNKPVYTGIQ